MAFTIRIGFYTLNEVVGDEALRYVMPSPAGLSVVDLVQLNASAGQMPPVSTSPDLTAVQVDPLANYR